MSTKINVQGYLDTVKAPWGNLFYKMIWHNLEFEGKNTGRRNDRVYCENEALGVSR